VEVKENGTLERLKFILMGNVRLITKRKGMERDE
jgi:hypothetical protein